MKVASRISKLEHSPELAGPRRCPTCRSWPSWRITHQPDIFAQDDDATPELCPRCGWAPGVIVVDFGDWSPDG